MKVNEDAIALIARWEGLAKVGDGGFVYPYLDHITSHKELWTVGYGSTFIDGVRVTEHTGPFTREQCMILLRDEVEHVYAPAVRRNLKWEIPDDMFGALVSFTYNLGETNLRSSTLIRKVNREDYWGAVKEFPKWNRAGGRVRRGLTFRRRQEASLFMRGILELEYTEAA